MYGGEALLLFVLVWQGASLELSPFVSEPSSRPCKGCGWSVLAWRIVPETLVELSGIGGAGEAGKQDTLYGVDAGSMTACVSSSG